MFKRILLPVDGSLCMAPLVRQCLAFAAAAGARVIAVHVAPSPDATAAPEGPPGPGGDPLARAARILQDVAGEARALAVPCDGKVLFGAEPWRAIVQAAIDAEADLVCMGAHGRHGAAEQVLASQSVRVVAHTRIPVLLFH